MSRQFYGKRYKKIKTINIYTCLDWLSLGVSYSVINCLMLGVWYSTMCQDFMIAAMKWMNDIMLNAAFFLQQLPELKKKYCLQI